MILDESPNDKESLSENKKEEGEVKIIKVFRLVNLLSDSDILKGNELS